MPTYQTSARERLLALIHGDKVTADRQLRRMFTDDDDPILMLFVELMERQEMARKSIGETVHGAVRREHEEQRRILQAIYHPRTWKRLLASRILGWIVAPAVLAAVILWGLENISSKQLKVLSNFTRDTSTIMAFTDHMKTAAGLATEAQKNAETMLAVGALLNHPNLEITREGGNLRISGDLRIEQKDGKPSVLIGGDGLKTIIYTHQMEERRKEKR